MKLKDGRHKHFWWADNSLIEDGHMAQMGCACFTVYCVLLKLSDSEGQCFPSYTYIAEKTGLSRRSAISAIKKLLELGYLEKTESGNFEGKSNTYLVKDLTLVKEVYQGSENTSPGLVQDLHPPSEKNDSTLVQGLHPNKTNRTKPIEQNPHDRACEEENSSEPVSQVETLPVESIEETSQPGNGITQDQEIPPRFTGQFKSSAQRCDDRFKRHDPWVLSGRFMDFHAGFVAFVRSHYLPKLEFFKSKAITLADAKGWINDAKYREDRHDKVMLWWEEYQNSLKPQENFSQAAPLTPYQQQLKLYRELKNQHPDWTDQQIDDRIAEEVARAIA